ncbi:hypothetical protein AMAG_20293, partial [Allomyces macrogynus ATCC 38327]
MNAPSSNREPMSGTIDPVLTGAAPCDLASTIDADQKKLLPPISVPTTAVPVEDATRDSGAISELGFVTVTAATTAAAESRMGSLLPAASDRKLGPDLTLTSSFSSSREHGSESVG